VIMLTFALAAYWCVERHEWIDWSVLGDKNTVSQTVTPKPIT